MGTTTIKLKISTIDRIKAHGKMGDSYDVVINRILDENENKERGKKKE